MKIFRALLIFVAWMHVAAAYAWPIRGNPQAAGSAQLNLGADDYSEGGMFQNFLKAAAFSIGLDPSKLDNNGFPNTTLATSYGGNFYLPSGYWTATTDFVVQWKGAPGARLKFTVNIPNVIQSACTNMTASAGVGVPSFATDFTTDGINTVATCTIRLTNYNARQGSFFFPSGFANVGGTTDLGLIRASDLAAYNSDDCQIRYQCFTSEFINIVRALGPPNTLRTMGLTHTNNSFTTTWNYRATPSRISWVQTGMYPNGAWGGACSGSGTYTVNPAPDSPTNWTDGEIIQCSVANANSGTTTLRIGTRSAKNVVFYDYTALSNGSIAANSLATFFYDSVLDKVLYVSGGMTPGLPIELQVGLANQVRANLWTNFGAWWSDDNITMTAAYVRDNLNPALVAYFEYGNEIWNNSSGFTQATQFAQQRGTAFGFSQPVYGWAGLRHRQAMGLVTTVYAGQMQRVRRALMFQGGGSVSAIPSYLLNGRELAPSGTGTGAGNATYVAYTGGANYTTSPNRPVDYADSIGYAPYAGGTSYCRGADIGCTPNANNVPFYNSVIAAWEAGDSTSAVALVDEDVRQGRVLVQNVTASGTTFTTGSAHGFTAGSTRVAFQVTGGTMYSGINSKQLYLILATPTSTTFTIQPYVNGSPTGVAVNAGSAGSGTVTVGASSTRNMQYVANIWGLQWEAVAASYDSGRATPLRMDLYEGNLEPLGPSPGNSSGQCTNLGLTTTQTFSFSAATASGSATISSVPAAAFAGLMIGMNLASTEISGTVSILYPQTGQIVMSGSATGTNPSSSISVSGSGDNACSVLNQALWAWLYSSSARSTTTSYFNQFMGYDSSAVSYNAMPHSKMPSWLVLPGPSVWAMTPGGYFTTPFQTYYGFADFRVNWLLERDIYPASNDNTPMWLEKAA